MKEARGKARRRRAEGGSQSPFHCGCSKSYQSYPALYTHVKNKHDGVFPLGSNARRKAPLDPQMPPSFFERRPDLFRLEFAEVCAGLQHLGREEAPPLRWGALQPLHAIICAGESVGGLPAVLARFAHFVQELAPPAFCREYELLLALLLQAVQERGGRGPHTAHTLVETLNLFTADLFPRYLRAFCAETGEELCFLGFEEERIRFLILMVKLLAGWLFHHALIDYRLEINAQG